MVTFSFRYAFKSGKTGIFTETSVYNAKIKLITNNNDLRVLLSGNNFIDLSFFSCYNVQEIDGLIKK
jgi:hypothetical protein